MRFYTKVMDQNREWINQAYSRAKKDPVDWRLPTRVRRKATKLLKRTCIRRRIGGSAGGAELQSSQP